MRRTRGRLAEHRDDLHSMSANSAVTLMKEAVDSAIKHGDIRLDAVYVCMYVIRITVDIDHRPRKPATQNVHFAWLWRLAQGPGP